MDGAIPNNGIGEAARTAISMTSHSDDLHHAGIAGLEL